MVLSAVILAGMGVFLSLRQVRSLSGRLTDQVRSRAEQAAKEIDARLTEPLHSEKHDETGEPLQAQLLRQATHLLAPDRSLRIVPREDATNSWTVPLSFPLEAWVVVPTEEFVREQQSATMTQSAAYLGLTLMSLAALSFAVWYLMKLARREIALAELKANFVADVSHELKTPLALIRLYAETLQSGRVPTEEKKQEYYAVIARESTRLTELINGILDFASIEAGRKAYELQPTDVCEVVRDTYNAYRPQLDSHAFEHHLTMDPAAPRVDADPDAISQVLVNLIINAIKYSQAEKYLSIDLTTDVRRGKRGVLISVHDRGIGIRPEDRARLTEGFFRAPDDRVRQQGGTGLGLALVKRIVEAHNGSLDIESRLVKGSSFRVFLPASSTGGT